MKTINDTTGIDIAFYLNIYLNLVEPFGIDDLITTFDKKLEFDIELEDKLVKMHMIPWNFVTDFYKVLSTTKQLNYLKNLDNVLSFDLNEVDKLAFNNTIIKDTISDMKGFLQQIKAGNELAKQRGKAYLFVSTYPIPYVIKKWFKQNNIKFKKSNYNNWWSKLKNTFNVLWGKLFRNK